MPIKTAIQTALKKFSHRLPDFLVVGTQKGGTTSLQLLLEQHPSVYLPSCKEVHYFSLRSDKTTSWYAEHFLEAKRSQKIGEITPFYLFHPRAPERIHAVIPRAKIIVLLRDPVERTISQVFHAKRHGFEKLDIEGALNSEKERLEKGDNYSLQKHSYVARSRYLEQIERYERLFPRENILVLKSEELFNRTNLVWEQIQEFIKVKKCPLPGLLPKANTGEGERDKIDTNIRRRLKEELRDTASGVREKYGINWGWP